MNPFKLNQEALCKLASCKFLFSYVVWLKAESTWVSLVEKNYFCTLCKRLIYVLPFLLAAVDGNKRGQRRPGGQVVKMLPKETRICPPSLTSWANHLNFLELVVLIHKTTKLNETNPFKINIQFLR